MSAISSATFGVFATAILRFIGKSLMLIIPSLILAHWDLSLAGCVSCIGRTTLSSPPPTLITSRLTTTGRTHRYVSCLHLIVRSKLCDSELIGLAKRRSIRPELSLLAPFHPSSLWKTDFVPQSLRRSKHVCESDRRLVMVFLCVYYSPCRD